MPKHKSICIQIFLSLLALQKAKYRCAATGKIHDVNDRAGVWAHDQNFDKFHRHQDAGQATIYDVPRRNIGHMDIVGKERAWALRYE